MAAGIEDDQLVLAHAFLSYTGQYHKVDFISGFTSIERTSQNSEGFDDDFGNIRIDKITEYIRNYSLKIDRHIDAFGVGVFGNVNGDTQIAYYIPNRGDFAGQIRPADFPADLKGTELDSGKRPFADSEVVVDNDASAAAMGEYMLGAGRESPALAYIWAGRGINAGLILGKDLWEGRLHPEIGHLYPRRHSADLSWEKFRGNCAVHGDCLLGLASYRSIKERLANGMSQGDVSAIIANYYAQLCVVLTLTVSPERIVIGGYLLREQVLPNLLAEIQSEFKRLIGHFPDYAAAGREGEYIREGELEHRASVIGMIEIARRHLDKAAMGDSLDG